MPKYTLTRDAGFLKGVTNEIVKDIISMEVAIYKLDISSTRVNIYGESTNKTFKPAVRVFAIVRPGTKDPNDDGLMSFSKTFTFGFIKSELKEKNLAIEAGDFIFYDEKYFEVDKVSNSNYWSGRSPNSALGITQDQWSLYGYDYSIVADAHLTSEPSFIENQNTTGAMNTDKINSRDIY